jgi:hypothetical protein
VVGSVVIIGRRGVLSGDEVAVVEEGAGFGDDQEGEDWPVSEVGRWLVLGWFALMGLLMSWCYVSA